MTLIYEPRGRAREYSALACNIYRGCDHGCVYCYAPSATQRKREDFHQATTRPNNFLATLEKEARQRHLMGEIGRVLLCFTCDPYSHLDKELMLTQHVIQILHGTGHQVEVLTKGGSRALRDLGLFTPDDAFATTMTLLDDGRSREWEPHAALPSERIRTIQHFHEAGIPTWVSLEPVLDPNVALDIIRLTYNFVDVYKVGKLNYASSLPEHLKSQVSDIHWDVFAVKVIELLRSKGYQRNLDPDSLTGGQFYVKRDLATFLE